MKQAVSPPAGKAAMNVLYRKLEETGFKKQFVVRHILPTWWKDEMAANPSTLAQAQLILSRELQIQIDSLLSSEAVTKRERGSTRFKTRTVSPPAECEVAITLATRMATLASRSCIVPYDPSRFCSARAVRDAILREGAAAVDFKRLLDYCWTSGVPVLYLRETPSGCKRPDGLIASSEGRPVIVISSGKKDVAWHLFYIAHELGHLLGGHLEEEGLIFDQKVEFEADRELERQANALAVELLTGTSDFMLDSIRFRDAAHLAGLASAREKMWKIDAGFLALNFSHRRANYFAAAASALKQLHPVGEEAPEAYSGWYEYLDLSRIPGDSSRVFRALAGAE